MEVQRLKIGVMGSAGGKMDEEIIEKCKALGRAIADEGCAILTGGCPGLPHYAVIGCTYLRIGTILKVKYRRSCVGGF